MDLSWIANPNPCNRCDVKLSGMTFEETRQAYERRSDDYIAMFPSICATDREDRDLIQSWAIVQTGPILDVGCGPGHWTGWLHGQGLDIEGIDPVPAFIDHARLSHPEARFRVGRAEALGVETASLAGILAWYSLIHTDPGLLGETFSEFARALGAGGGLCVGFFAGPDLTPFDHPVSRAYFWPVSRLVAVTERAGFTVTSTQLRQDLGARNHAALLARRNP